MSVEITFYPPLTPTLRHELIAVWADVTQVGGAVDFILQPITAAEIESVADENVSSTRERTQHLVVATDNGKLVGWFVLENNAMPLVSHWAWFKRLMVIPTLQGRGIGRILTAGAIDAGRQLELEQLYLTCRSDTGLSEYHTGLGCQLRLRLDRCQESR